MTATTPDSLDAVMRRTREDPRTGTRSTVGFLGSTLDQDPDRAEIFACTHSHADPRAPGVVICPPLHVEFLRIYRRELLLAEAVAAAGLAAQRFHYRGTGHSGGDPGTLTLATMVQDAQTAADWLRRETGVSQLIFLGTRLGALVAAAAARDRGAMLVLWEPVLDTDAYVREAFRARIIRDLKAGTNSGRPSQARLLLELRSRGVVDVLGYPVYERFYDSVRGRTLDCEGIPDVLLVQFSWTGEPRPSYARFADRLQRAGTRVAVRLVPDDVAWWFFDERWEPEEDRVPVRLLVDLTTEWLRARAAKGRPQ